MNNIEENLKIVLDFVERWNKQDAEEDVAQACVELEEDILIMKNYTPNTEVQKEREGLIEELDRYGSSGWKDHDDNSLWEYGWLHDIYDTYLQTKGGKE